MPMRLRMEDKAIFQRVLPTLKAMRKVRTTITNSLILNLKIKEKPLRLSTEML